VFFHLKFYKKLYDISDEKVWNILPVSICIFVIEMLQICFFFFNMKRLITLYHFDFLLVYIPIDPKKFIPVLMEYLR